MDYTSYRSQLVPQGLYCEANQCPQVILSRIAPNLRLFVGPSDDQVHVIGSMDVGLRYFQGGKGGEVLLEDEVFFIYLVLSQSIVEDLCNGMAELPAQESGPGDLFLQGLYDFLSQLLVEGVVRSQEPVDFLSIPNDPFNSFDMSLGLPLLPISLERPREAASLLKLHQPSDGLIDGDIDQFCRFLILLILDDLDLILFLQFFDHLAEIGFVHGEQLSDFLVIEGADFGDSCLELWSIACLSAQLIERFLVLLPCGKVLSLVFFLASLRVLFGSDLKWLLAFRRAIDGHPLYLLEYALFSFLFLAIFATMLMGLGGFVVYEWLDGYFILIFRGFVKKVMDLIEFSR